MTEEFRPEDSATQNAPKDKLAFLATERRIERLVDRIIDYDDDDVAHAFIVIVDLLIYERDASNREGYGIAARNRAYAHTSHFHAALRRFETMSPDERRRFIMATYEEVRGNDH